MWNPFKIQPLTAAEASRISAARRPKVEARQAKRQARRLEWDEIGALYEIRCSSRQGYRETTVWAYKSGMSYDLGKRLEALGYSIEHVNGGGVRVRWA